MIQSKSRIRFSELQKLIRGADNVPEGINAICRNVLNSALQMEIITDSEMNELFDDLRHIEISKWYGTWKVKNIHFAFRYGVCQSYLSCDKHLKASKFDLNDVNKAVDFSKEKTK